MKSGEMPFVTGWDLSLSGEITWESDKFFSFRSSVTAYFGGVHPDVYYRNGTYSRKLGRRMVVSDLFRGKDLLSVATIICKEISESRHSSEYLRNGMSNEVVRIQSGFYKSYADYAGDPEENRSNGDIGGNPNVTDNFMIVEDGVVWTYNEYEIDSYSEGHTDVLVPWKSLAPYLKSKDIIDAPTVVGIFEQKLNKAEEEEGRTKRIGNLEFF